MADPIPLALLPREIARLTGAPGPSYRRLYCAVLDGRIPAERGTNGRWTVARDDLQGIAAALSGQASQPRQLAA